MTAAVAFDDDSGPILRVVPAAVPDDELSLDELGSRIVGLAGRLAAGTCRWLLLVARFDERQGWSAFGLPSTARWLSHCCGLSRRTAVEHVRVARALRAFPSLAAEMGAGRLSYSHVRAISRAAREGEDRTVEDLIHVARHGTIGQVETVVRGLRTVADNHNDAGNHSDTGREAPEEYLSQRWTSGSQWQCHARLNPENGALVRSALDRICADEALTRPQALLRMAEIALTVLNDADRPPRPVRGDERAAFIVHLDADRLFNAAARGAPDGGTPAPAGDVCPADDPIPADDRADNDAVSPTDRVIGQAHSGETEPAAHGTAARSRSVERGAGSPRAVAAGATLPLGGPAGRIADGPGLPDAVLLWLACAGRIRTAAHDGEGNVRDLGRSRRVVTERLFRVLLLRDGGCRHPGCRSRSALEAHHVRHWLFGGRTDLANLVLLCRAHHHAHHDGEFEIDRPRPGVLRFLRRDGRELENHVDPARLADRSAPIEADDDRVTADAARSQWRGDRLDRRWAVAVLAQRRESVRAASNTADPAVTSAADSRDEPPAAGSVE